MIHPMEVFQKKFPFDLISKATICVSSSKVYFFGHIFTFNKLVTHWSWIYYDIV